MNHVEANSDVAIVAEPAPLSNARRDQIFPALTPEQIGRIAAHGTLRSTHQGEVLIKAGEVVIPCLSPLCSINMMAWAAV